MYEVRRQFDDSVVAQSLDLSKAKEIADRLCDRSGRKVNYVVFEIKSVYASLTIGEIDK